MTRLHRPFAAMLMILCLSGGQFESKVSLIPDGDPQIAAKVQEGRYCAVNPRTRRLLREENACYRLSVQNGAVRLDREAPLRAPPVVFRPALLDHSAVVTEADHLVRRAVENASGVQRVHYLQPGLIRPKSFALLFVTPDHPGDAAAAQDLNVGLSETNDRYRRLAVVSGDIRDRLAFIRGAIERRQNAWRADPDSARERLRFSPVFIQVADTSGSERSAQAIDREISEIYRDLEIWTAGKPL